METRVARVPAIWLQPTGSVRAVCRNIPLDSFSEQFRNAAALAISVEMRAIDTKRMDNADLVRPLAVRVRDACKLVGIGRSKLYELIRAGEISTFKVGTMTLISIAELERFVAVRTNAEQPLQA